MNKSYLLAVAIVVLASYTTLKLKQVDNNVNNFSSRLETHGPLLGVTSEFNFYKLSLVWPTSACNVRTDCKASLPNYFTIHGLWPQFANDTKVDPYAKKKCTDITPTSAADALVALAPIKNPLELMWPQLLNKDENLLWKTEWEHHGMCSDYPQQPFDYFDAGLTLAMKYDPLELMGITPGGDTPHKVKDILEAVWKKVKAYPQIACNVLKNDLQLREIRFCFKRAKPPHILMDCPNTVDLKACKSENDEIKFPQHQ